MNLELNNIGSSLWQLGHGDRAVEAYQSILLDPTSPEALR